MTCRTFNAFCRAHNLIAGKVQHHADGFTYMRAKSRETSAKVLIYFDEDEDCVLYY